MLKLQLHEILIIIKVMESGYQIILFPENMLLTFTLMWELE